jgi:hypothetical protein
MVHHGCRTQSANNHQFQISNSALHYLEYGPREAVPYRRNPGPVHREHPVDARRNVGGAGRDPEREHAADLRRYRQRDAPLIQVCGVRRDAGPDQGERVRAGRIHRNLYRSSGRECRWVGNGLDDGPRCWTTCCSEQVRGRQYLKVGVVLVCRTKAEGEYMTGNRRDDEPGVHVNVLTKLVV